ncbi:MAG: SDR family oxidoreductase [Lentilitoribacter sp.]
MANKIDLTGRTAFITGASRGIGQSTAHQMAKYGANVVLAARSIKDCRKIADEIGDKALAIKCDVANYDDVKSAIDHATDHFGGIDILVNNAGIIDPISMLESSDPEAWSRVVDVNFKGVYNCLHASFPALKASTREDKRSIVINISSGAATSMLPGWSHYSATKAAVLSLTRTINREWSEHSISVIGLSPGTVATDMQRSIKTSQINVVSQMDWSEHIEPEWPAEAICWLTTDAAREFDGTDFSIKTEEGRKLVGLI